MPRKYDTRRSATAGRALFVGGLTVLRPDEDEHLVPMDNRRPSMETETIEAEWAQENALRAQLKALMDELNRADLLLLSSELMQRFGFATHEERERCGLSFDTDYE